MGLADTGNSGSCSLSHTTSNCSSASVKSCPQSSSVCSSSTSCRLELCLGYVCQPGMCVPSVCAPTPYRPDTCLSKAHLASSCQPSSCRPTSRISSSMGSYSPYFEGSFNGNEKETMQFLNNHLASYLERVQRLERDNAQLESRIRDASQSQAPALGPD
ncbi:hypothetical protein J1605_023341 [Eschrichtius robustus]|uniref:IF rod domain-containing protein n=1 Tax=Eschrichtius robustus TaxID=9764 RepID=A0AB34H5D4_ESCRO|nr:hypothetical protein J1605_023341 [Eschrichtius robustus]MBW00852.1 Keratin, type I cuticular Ha2 [Eschrichtius robustus]